MDTYNDKYVISRAKQTHAYIQIYYYSLVCECVNLCVRKHENDCLYYYAFYLSPPFENKRINILFIVFQIILLIAVISIDCTLYCITPYHS